MKHIYKPVLFALLALAPLALRAADLAVLGNGFEIRHEKRQVMGANTRLYLDADASSGYVDVPTNQIMRYEHDDSIRPKPAPPLADNKQKRVEIDSAVSNASNTHAIDPDLIASVIHAESRFNAHAVSPKGAQGLMQLMPGTASQLGVADAFDPATNVDAGTRYLRELLLRYNDDMAKALAAYNAGPQRVDQYRGVPPYRETRRYVAGIIRDFNRKKLAENHAPAPARGSKASATPARNRVRLGKGASKPIAHSTGQGTG